MNALFCVHICECSRAFVKTFSSSAGIFNLTVFVTKASTIMRLI